MICGRLELLLQPPKQSVDDRLAILFINRFGQWDIHWAGLHAVLGIAAIGDAVFTHDSFEAFVAIHFTAGMHVKETNLCDCLRPDVMILIVLRASFETATAGHATRVSISLHHVFLIHARPRAEIVSAVEFDPGMNSL